MARIETRRAEAEEEELIEAEAFEEEEEIAAAPAPAVSDSRRRRQAKRGELPAEPVSAAVVTPRKDRPTPSQREEPEHRGNVITRFFGGIRRYARETAVELNKVAWPTREEIVRLTTIVIAVTIVSALFLGTASFLFSLLVTNMAIADTSTVFGIISIVMIIVVAGLWLFRERIFKRVE
ncbi:MAG: preprotein translocase subunit SecE [Anaerolineae bacterium]|nr:preprotein translocase subunit SecE [Anaerolineae bacterium]